MRVTIKIFLHPLTSYHLKLHRIRLSFVYFTDKTDLRATVKFTILALFSKKVYITKYFSVIYKHLIRYPQLQVICLRLLSLTQFPDDRKPILSSVTAPLGTDKIWQRNIDVKCENLLFIISFQLENES